jgi:hypothetical protein
MFPHHARAAEATKRIDLIRTREAEAFDAAATLTYRELGMEPLPLDPPA